MDNFKAVYRILSALEKAMDVPDFDTVQISAETLGISQQRWSRYLEMMEDAGYIKGVKISKYITGDIAVEFEDIRITLKGLEYLQENSIMQRFYKLAKGIKDIAPGV